MRTLRKKKADHRTSEERTLVSRKADYRQSSAKLGPLFRNQRPRRGPRSATKTPAANARGDGVGATILPAGDAGSACSDLREQPRAQEPGMPTEPWDKADTTACQSCGVVKLLTVRAFGTGQLCGYCSRMKASQNKYLKIHIDEQPGCLAELTFVEEMLITLELPLMYLCTLTPGGQLGYRSHTAVVGQNVCSVANLLPRDLGSLKSSLCTVRQSRRSGDCADFEVRPDKVIKALAWLVKNNPLYHHVTVSEANTQELYKARFFYGDELQDSDGEGSGAGHAGAETEGGEEKKRGANARSGSCPGQDLAEEGDGRQVEFTAPTTSGVVEGGNEILEEEKLKNALGGALSRATTSASTGGGAGPCK